MPKGRPGFLAARCETESVSTQAPTKELVLPPDALKAMIADLKWVARLFWGTLVGAGLKGAQEETHFELDVCCVLSGCCLLDHGNNQIRSSWWRG